MNHLRRCFSASAGCCVLSCLLGCSNAVSNSSTVTTTTPPAPPTQPTNTAKAKFAYVGNEGSSLSGFAVDPSSGVLTPLNGFPFAFGSNPTLLTHDPQNRFLIIADNGAADLLHVFAIDSTTGALKEVSPSPYITKNQPGLGDRRSERDPRLSLCVGRECCVPWSGWQSDSCLQSWLNGCFGRSCGLAVFHGLNGDKRKPGHSWHGH